MIFSGIFLMEIHIVGYAHMEIVVVLIVVKFGVFLVTTSGAWVEHRDHGSFGGRHQVEILPTGLPERPKPSKTSPNLRKTKVLETNISRTT